MTARKATTETPKPPREGKTLHAMTGGLLRKRTDPPRNVEERREALILLAVVVLFVANVVVYLCHHWNLTSANELQPRPPVAPRVIID